MRVELTATISIFICFCCAVTLFSDDTPPAQLPSSLLDLGTGSNSFALVVDKSKSRLEIYRKLENDSIIRVATYRASTGLNGGDKQREGDERTPEGIYYFVRIREEDELLSKYGLRAFDMNYPNYFDQLEGKDGHGIWLHATDEPERLNEPRTTLGCVVVSNEDIREISKFITLYRTPIIISEHSSYSNLEHLKAERSRVNDFVSRWLDAWSTQNYSDYESCYSEEFRGGGSRRDAWFSRKRNVFNATSWAKIEIADMKMLRGEKKYVVTFFQRYRSNMMDDTGIKWVYLQENYGGFKIVGEEWFSVGNALSAQRWGVKRPLLTSVVDDLGDVVLERDGRVALNRPQLMLPSAEIKAAEGSGGGEEIQVTGPLVQAEEFEIVSERDGRLEFSMKLSNTSSDGKRLRGWMFVIARWEGDYGYTSFPEGTLADGRPHAASAGDSFGIRWFKIVRGTIEKPAPGARLAEIRCIAYSRDGRLLLDAPLSVQ